MPRRSRRPCSQPGCPELVRADGRFCLEHERERNRKYDAERGTPAERGYDHRWRKIRRMYLRRSPLCEDPYNLHERRVKAEHVDHIKALNDGGDHSFENLQSLCHPCHSRKTALEDERWGPQ